MHIILFGIIGLGVFFGVWFGLIWLIDAVVKIIEYFGFELDRDQYGRLEIYSYIEIEHTLYISGFFGVATFITLFFIGDIFHWILRKKFCAWCGKKSGLTKEKECEGEYVWQHANADGSQDKRIKGNFQKANYLTYLRCEECSALTVLQHRMSQRPRSSEKVIKVMLSEDGEGERTAKDWKG